MDKPKNQTEYRRELRHKILLTAAREFKTKGIKAVKMDDIANLLSVSKRTVYEIYDNKEQLLMETVKEDHDCFARHMQEYTEHKHRQVMDVILEFYRQQMRRLTGVNPLYFTELHRYPEIVAWIDQKHAETDQDGKLFFQEGIKEGYFRDDVNFDLISKIFSGTLNLIMERQLYNQYSLTEIFHDIVMLFIRGFCTLKGIEELERRITDSKK